ncbi:TIGR03986 family type III CRISPR-associated RAMP protein [Caldithrix abyssi]
MSVKSPYNFVPISKHVVEYDHPEQVLHDMPFSDGLSGYVEVKLITQTPTYIRNSGNNNNDFFNAPIGKNNTVSRIIPGTSLKGTIRNVLEIISFSKLNKVTDHRYSIRDLSYSKYQSKLTEKVAGVIHPKVKAGWITQISTGDGVKWNLIPCQYARVELKDLEKYYFNTYHNNVNLNDRMSSIVKYQRWGNNLSIQFDYKEGDYQHSPGKIHYKRVTSLGAGKYSGTIVFTGQPFRRNERKKIGKHMEFIFFNKGNTSYDVTALKKDFEFIHTNENEEPNDEWKYWKRKLSSGEPMPVFYLEDKSCNVDSFGLAMMYRLPYPNKISDAIRNSNAQHFPKNNEEYIPDLSDMLFGFTHNINGKNLALKGRIQFGHLFETGESAQRTNSLGPITKILGSPKPTFYPYYIQQKMDNNFQVPKKGNKYDYKTLMDNDVELKGWKRYPSENIQPDLNSVPAGNTTTSFEPIDKNAEFTGKIKFFNLRPFELGALLWAISFGNNSLCQHKIGMGKPLGFGRVLLEISNLKIFYDGETHNIHYFLKEFENYMNHKIPNWSQTDQIKELITMADVSYRSNYASVYPILNPDTSTNEFVKQIKNRGYALPKYSQDSSKDTNIKILSSKKIKQQKQMEQKKQKAISKNPEIEKILNLTNSELKSYIKDESISLQDKKVLFDAYPLLPKSKQKIILDNLHKGKGTIFKVLFALEKQFGRTFPRS